jgi:hypothetical protein
LSRLSTALSCATRFRHRTGRRPKA